MGGKLPIGIQSFESIRRDGYLYVDKTDYVYKLVHEGKPYFLSRPRRFGKSLLISTLRAYWEGRRELFAGLAVERLEKGNPDAWVPHVVFHFDFNGSDYSSKGALEAALDSRLHPWEVQHGTADSGIPLGDRFAALLEAAHEGTGHRCVVLVDEYDKPMLETMGDPALQGHNRNVFKSFFSVLKRSDDHLRFAFFTGVTKFSKISIFSDLNQLRDISMSGEYASICGITERELVEYFDNEVALLADARGLTREKCLDRLANMYDGYRFYPAGPNVYNPFSLLNAFADRDFGAYWFGSGTPSFLVHRMREASFDARMLGDGSLWASEARIMDYRAEDPDPVPLMYQAGYLTIKDHDSAARMYELGVPNGEVRYGLSESLLAEYAPGSGAGVGTDVYMLKLHADEGDVDGIRNVLTALFASIPYTRADDPFENYFQAVVYLVFTLLGRFARCEMHSAAGRVDVVVETARFIYLMELKRDGTAEEALTQMDERGYAAPYTADSRTIFRIGAAFDSSTRRLSDWKVRCGLAS